MAFLRSFLCIWWVLVLILPLSFVSAGPVNRGVSVQGNVNVNQRLDHLFHSLKELEARGFVDGEVLIARGNRVLLHVQNKEIDHQAPQFMIGSVSKQFFAVALLKALYLASDGANEAAKIADVKRELHQPISKFLPAKSAIWNHKMPAWAEEVTLHQLLTHTSGIPNYAESEGFELSQAMSLDEGKRFFESYHSAAEVFKLVAGSPLLFKPGQRFSYSNTGYLIIAEVIESITATPASSYIQYTIFDPIGLKSTTSPLKGRWEELKSDSHYSKLVPELNYNPKGNIREVYPQLHCEDISVAKGAASVISTASDLLRWNLALHKAQSVLPEGLYDLLIHDNENHYGYGIGIGHSALGTVFSHQGEIGTYKSQLWYIPEQDLSIIVLSHINYDWSKLEKEFEFLMSDLEKQIPNEDRCFAIAKRTIHDRYPPQRGFEAIQEMLHQFAA